MSCKMKALNAFTLPKNSTNDVNKKQQLKLLLEDFRVFFFSLSALPYSLYNKTRLSLDSATTHFKVF